jgi:hypothetical protein
MGDNLRRYRAIKESLRQLFGKGAQGNVARHLDTLAALVSGIVGSQRVNLPDIASKVPDGTQRESRVKRFGRWLDNERVETEVYYLPFVQELLLGLASLGSLVLVMDGSEVGRGCLTLMLSVLYKGRALPLVWVVAAGSKGHFPDATHQLLLARLTPLLPEGVDVIFLGDGEFDGVGLQAAVAEAGWHYVCRTAKNVQVCDQGEWFGLDELTLTPGETLGLPEVLFSEAAYGPVLVIARWEAKYQDPLYLVSNFELVQEACFWYRKRATIETFFSDQKSRGFRLDKSHLSDPQRLARLLIATCLAYLWVVFLGALALHDDWLRVIHRPHRRDLSLFRLGLALLEHFLNEGLSLPVAFSMPIQARP